MSSPRKADMTTATNNAKQIFLLMVEFDDDFGEFPSDQSASKKDALKAYTGEYSNDYLGQFLAGGYVQSEEIFYAKGGKRRVKPDNDYSSKDTTLAEGECGFAYIKGLSTSDLAGTPLLLASMYGDGYKFNSDVYKGKAVVLRIDGSVQTLRLNKDRLAKLPNGKTLFEGGADTVWGEEGFDSSRLLYAKHPYDFKPAIVRKEWVTPPTIAVALIFLFICIYIGKKIARKPKQEGACPESGE
ncbi:hypothetical protein JIN77_15090 [Verrucomicrobiaceae bacterium R5-34]|uniref:Uncharacterized protein n=1 Tax=Oceaniferula flava TaxID=2800421 RepID=A0AAE2VD56_9BACT|nr:hypothetical protein [Oceaniferula flavus]MBK1832060.1 hypothetical protein [Verrucomicrobiaceae bacterium R5-34]MBK1854144.1 hypothetical protein [Oceaniferula flavus]MBM1135450.1 hypothetical protein [Oceaniferula flavus]